MKYLINGRFYSKSEALAMTSRQPKKPQPKVEEIKEEETNEELESLTVKELTVKAKEMGLEISSKAKKGDIVDAIEAALSESDEE